MYLARAPAGGSTASGERLKVVLKRMPDGGPAHAPTCASYSPPASVTGEDAYLRDAITTRSDGTIGLRCGFRLSAAGTTSPVQPLGGRSTAAGAAATGAATSPARLSLTVLLQLLWREAGLTRWSPAMEGKRTWAVIRFHLEQAAASMTIRGGSLAERLWTPETFGTDRKAEITARRLAAWSPYMPTSTTSAGHTSAGLTATRHHQERRLTARAGARAVARVSTRRGRLFLIGGEMKGLKDGRFNQLLLVKHLPDRPLALPDDLSRRLQRRCGPLFEMWEVDQAAHLMFLATVSLGAGGAPRVDEIGFMLTDQAWLPYDTPLDAALLELARTEGRRFMRIPRFNAPTAAPVPTLVLTDTNPPVAVHPIALDSTAQASESRRGLTTTAWSVCSDSPSRAGSSGDCIETEWAPGRPLPEGAGDQGRRST